MHIIHKYNFYIINNYYYKIVEQKIPQIIKKIIIIK